jgi:hypothetical protein
MTERARFKKKSCNSGQCPKNNNLVDDDTPSSKTFPLTSS